MPAFIEVLTVTNRDRETMKLELLNIDTIVRIYWGQQFEHEEDAELFDETMIEMQLGHTTKVIRVAERYHAVCAKMKAAGSSITGASDRDRNRLDANEKEWAERMNRRR